MDLVGKRVLVVMPPLPSRLGRVVEAVDDPVFPLRVLCDGARHPTPARVSEVLEVGED